jgi:hypothetical protein
MKGHPRIEETFQMYSSMPRTRVNYRLDDRVLAALNDLAGKGKTNQFIEGLLIDFLQKTGRLPNDFAPLTESRGGARQGAGKPKRSPTDEEPIAPPPETVKQSKKAKAVDEAID